MTEPEDPRGLKVNGDKASNGLVALTLGSRQSRQYIVKADVLNARTNFLRDVTRYDLQDDVEVIQIPNSNTGDVKALHCYLDYTGHGKILSMISTTGDSKKDENAHLEEWDLICRANILGTSLADVEFQNVAMDALVCKFKAAETKPRLPAHHSIVDVYKRTNHGASLRRLLVDMVVKVGDDRLLKACSGEKANDFVYDVCQALMHKQIATREDDQTLLATTPCEYHMHHEGQECYSKKRKQSEVVEGAAVRQDTTSSHSRTGASGQVQSQSSSQTSKGLPHPNPLIEALQGFPPESRTSKFVLPPSKKAKKAPKTSTKQPDLKVLKKS